MSNLVVFASHGGTILQAVLDACGHGRLAARVQLVVSNNSKAEALVRARRSNVPTLHLSSVTHPDKSEREQHLLQALENTEADWLLLAGYMKKLAPAVLRRYHNRVLNVHPSLLPRHGGVGLYGRKVHEAVIAAGDSESGATVHLVDGEYDTGSIVAQVRVPVLAQDEPVDLERRVKAAERALLIDTLEKLLLQ